MVYKCCVVPFCRSTSKKTPQKLFVSVPTKAERRKIWLQLARRDAESIVNHSNVFMCEDHFDMKKATKNFMQYKMGFSQNILLENDAVPTKFDCQKGLLRRQTGKCARAVQVQQQRIGPDKNCPQRKSSKVDDSSRRHDSSDGEEVDHEETPEFELTQQQLEASSVELESRPDDERSGSSLAGEEGEEMVTVKVESGDEPTEPAVKEEIIECHEPAIPELELQHYKTLYYNMKEQTARLEIQNQRLTDENQILNEKLRSFTNRIEELLQKHEKHKSEKQREEQSVKKIESVFIKTEIVDNDNLAEQNKSLARNIEAVVKQNHTQMQEIQELTERNVSLSSKIHELNISNQRLTATVEKLKDNTNSRKDDANKFMQKIEIVIENGSNVDAVIKQNHTQMREIKELTEKNISLSSKVHELGLSNQRLAATVERLKDDKNTRKDDENEFVKKIEILTEDASRLGDENKRLRQQIQELTRTNKHTTEKIEDNVKEAVKSKRKQELTLRSQHTVDTKNILKETLKRKRKV